MSDSPKKDDLPPGEDFAIPLGPSDDGGLRVIRHHSDHTVSSGTFRMIEEGKPVHGEIVEARAREEGGFSLKSVYKPESAGPAKVNSPAFKDGWDRIWEKKRKKGEKPN